MLFDLKPKERLADLFDRREDYAELSRLVRHGSWVAVLGKRMTGKTSLVKTFAKENGGVYVNLMGARSTEELARRLAEEAGFSLREVGLDLKLVQLKWSRLVEEAFSRLKDRVVVLDEVQEVASPYMLRILKRLWDTYGKLRIIFSGSMVGLTRRLLEPSPTSPLYGRTPARIMLRPFSREESTEFLVEGFKEHRVAIIRHELEDAVEKLDGYVGWLTYYGNFRCIGRLSHEAALRGTVREGVKIFREELANLLRNRRRDFYIKVLKMALVGARWSELKNELDINSKVLRDVVRTLTDTLLLEERDGYYEVTDPILRQAVRGMRTN